MKRWREVMSSAVFRVTLIVIAVLVPLNLLTLLLADTVISEVERQVAVEAQNSLRLYMAQVDETMARMSTKLHLLAKEDVDFAWLNLKPLETPEDRYRHMESVVRLNNTVNELLDDNPLIDGAFQYFPDKEYFLIQGNSGLRDQKVREAVAEELEQAETQLYSRWKLMKMGEEYVLALVGSYRGAYYGAWIGAKTLAEAMGVTPQEESIRLLTDPEGVVFCANWDGLTGELWSQVQGRFDTGLYTRVEVESNTAQLAYVQMISREEISGALPMAIKVMQVLSLAALCIIPVIMVSIRRWMIVPVHQLTEAMEKIEEGDMEFRIAQTGVGTEFARINSNFNHMMDEVSRLKISVYEEQLETQKIKMRFLSQQIQPHFILNALNVLYSYDREEYPLIQRMILCLSRYFRYVVNANADFVELGPELKHIGNYFEIQQARYLQNFQARVECDPGLEHCLVPPLLIQNFAENVIKHSLSMEGMVHVTIQVRRQGEDKIYISIADNGSGISQEVLDLIQRFRETRTYQKGLGIGIQNSIERVEMLYGGAGEIKLSRGDPCGTLVEIWLPLRRKEEVDNDCDID